MRIGLLTHSTNPRGGVVHALALADALVRAGHEATVVAPAADAVPFFRDGPARRIVVPVPRSTGDLATDVATRIDALAACLANDALPICEIWHAQDPIGANALARPDRHGRTRLFVRTVHHVDRHDDVRLDGWQDHAIRSACRVCCVSALWRRRLRTEWQVDAANVGNGVDTARFTPVRASRDAALARRLGLPVRTGPTILLVGGIEWRKNTRTALLAFAQVAPELGPDATLVIAGGASLLDHSAERDAFAVALASSGVADRVVFAGVLDDDDMPSLYRVADAVLSPSRAEGFGLVAIEAAASGVPAIVSAIPPFTEHFGGDECVFVDPDDAGSVADGLRRALFPAVRERLARSGPAMAARFTWDHVAERQLAVYRTMPSTTDAEERCDA